MIEEKYTVSGMSCTACSSAVERVTRRLDGVERADVNLTTGKLLVCYDESKVTPEMIIEKVKKCGFGIEKDTPETETKALSHISAARLPETRIVAMPPTPAGVATAAIVLLCVIGSPLIRLPR